MAKPRYTPEEKARLIECTKPVERWTRAEKYFWDRSPHGFRYFAAKNIVPIEHFMPEPIGVFEAYGRDNSPPPARRSPRTPRPPKPAA